MDFQYKAIGALAIFIVLILVIYVRPYINSIRQRKKRIETEMLTDKEETEHLNTWIAPLGFAFDRQQSIFYSRIDAWQKKHGYKKKFDESAIFHDMVIDCEPIYFQYDGKEWLIEFFKGQYFIAAGAEIGVYYREMTDGNFVDKNKIFHSVREKDLLKIQLSLYKYNKKLFHRKGFHWWLTGFSLGTFANAKDLKMRAKITFQNEEMRDAFLIGLSNAGYQKEEFKVLDTTVSVFFHIPHTIQPKNKTRFQVFTVQSYNKKMCRKYNKLTADYDSSYEKLLALKIRDPQMFHRLVRSGKGILFFQERFDEQI